MSFVNYLKEVLWFWDQVRLQFGLAKDLNLMAFNIYNDDNKFIGQIKKYDNDDNCTNNQTE